MLRLRPDHDAVELAAVMDGLSTAANRLPGCGGFIHGPNRDFEAKSPGYPYGFTLDFAAEVDLRRYASDETHQLLGARLVALCVDGAEGVLVFDLEMPDTVDQ
ncbi:stress responsive alpha/beta barrel protein [Ruegeria conchae]|uniref:Stress responsive alpha/beta barrel protein n=2 Tax=Ruegeria conchae TaxID=981384 RepID=A0A497ZT87_9RHOB|nr:stress responsive alpha/beta barrel protein [Ruegeria conchae]